MTSFARPHSAKFQELKPTTFRPASNRPGPAAYPGASFLQRKPACTCGGGCPLCQTATGTNLKIGEPDDAFEREADAVADKVMRMEDAAILVAPAAPGLQCKCAACANEDEEETLVQTKAVAPPSAERQDGRATAPPSVQEELNSPGQPLASETRAFFEPRFGFDFGDVRVHTDARAAESAEAIDALAYTVDRHIVFGGGQYQPSAQSGRTLIAHELAHVVQQTSGLSRNLISRQASTNPVNCPAGKHGAPAGADKVLDSLEILALLGTVLADADLSLLQLDAILPGLGAGGGYTMPAGNRMDLYKARFGLPSAAGGGKFRNRLSGAKFPSQAEALVEEVKSLQGRYSRIGDFLTGSRIRFLCITNPTTVGDCTGHCVGRSATGCFNGVVMLCPSFWGLAPDVRAMLLIHEAAHAIFGILHGYNLTHADCYAAYAADARGSALLTTPACTP